jgi:hypothetical protein
VGLNDFDTKENATIRYDMVEVESTTGERLLSGCWYGDESHPMFTRDSLDGQVHQNKAPGCPGAVIQVEAHFLMNLKWGSPSRGVGTCFCVLLEFIFLFPCPPQTHKDFTMFPCSASLHVPCVPCKIFLAHSCSLVPWKPLGDPLN